MTPRLPQELVDKIIEFVAMRERNTKMQDLKSCSLTAKSWSHASQRYILEAITISFDHLSAWASGEYLMGGISSYVQTLTLCGDNDLARRFPPGCIAKLPAFAKLECLTLKKFCLHSGIEHIKLILKWFRLIGGKLKTLNLDTCSLSPNAFQSILRRFPLLDNVSIDECLAVVNTEGDSTLKPPLSDTTNFRGSLDVGTNTPEEFLSCLLTAPLHFSHLVYDYSREGYQILSACASTLQILILEDECADDIQVDQISFPELRTLEFWIGDWEDVDPMVKHHFPLIKSAPSLSTIRVKVNETTGDADILFFRSSPGWEEVDNQLCRLAEKALGPVTLGLDETFSLKLAQGVSEILESSNWFLPRFRKAGGNLESK